MTTAEKTGMAAVRASMRTLTGLAREVGRSKQAVSNWNQVPEDLVDKVCEYTGLPPHVVRPDLFKAKRGRA